MEIKFNYSLIKKYWFFYLSLIALYVLEIPLRKKGVFSICVALLVVFIWDKKIKCILELWERTKKAVRIYSFLTSAGICLYGIRNFAIINKENSIIGKVTSKIASYISCESNIVFRVLSVITGICAIFAAYILVCALWTKLIDIFVKDKIFLQITKAEAVVLLLTFILTCAVATYAFSKSGAFFGQDYPVDILFTSDSGSIVVSNNAYLELDYFINDLHQVLFAVFSAPFIGGVYLFGQLLPCSSFIIPLLINYVQIAMLIVSNLIFAESMDLFPKQRVCFILISCFSYSYMLFSLMMEQYIIACFWLALFVNQIAKKDVVDDVVCCAAGGTMLTSFALLPFISFSDIKEWIKGMFSRVFQFILCVLGFGRLNTLLELGFFNAVFIFAADIEMLSFRDKVVQFFSFVRSCFFAPACHVCFSFLEMYSWMEGKVSTDFIKKMADGVELSWGANHPSWQVVAYQTASWFGVAVVCFALISFILNRKKKICRVSAYWILFSFFITVIIGYGVKENGLILYVLYFGWAYLILLFELLRWMEEKIHCKWLISSATVVYLVICLFVNIPAMRELFEFCFSYYPIK